jgi:hypothetical protein
MRAPLTPRLLTAQECAILLLRLIELRNHEGTPTSRVRLSDLTLRRLWGRHRLDREFVEEVQEWLFRGGWTIFFAGSTYAAIKTSAVLNWSRLSSKRLFEEVGTDDLRFIQNGDFDFARHTRLLTSEADIYDSD